MHAGFTCKFSKLVACQVAVEGAFAVLNPCKRVEFNDFVCMCLSYISMFYTLQVLLCVVCEFSIFVFVNHICCLVYCYRRI